MRRRRRLDARATPIEASLWDQILYKALSMIWSDKTISQVSTEESGTKLGLQEALPVPACHTTVLPTNMVYSSGPKHMTMQHQHGHQLSRLRGQEIASSLENCLSKRREITPVRLLHPTALGGVCHIYCVTMSLDESVKYRAKRPSCVLKEASFEDAPEITSHRSLRAASPWHSLYMLSRCLQTG